MCTRVIEGHQFIQPLARVPEPDVIEIARLHMGAAKDDPRLGGGAFEDGFSFFGERFRVVGTHPIHVIEQHEARNTLYAALKKRRHALSMRLDPIDQSILK